MEIPKMLFHRTTFERIALWVKSTVVILAGKQILMQNIVAKTNTRKCDVPLVVDENFDI